MPKVMFMIINSNVLFGLLTAFLLFWLEWITPTGLVNNEGFWYKRLWIYRASASSLQTLVLVGLKQPNRLISVYSTDTYFVLNLVQYIQDHILKSTCNLKYRSIFKILTLWEVIVMSHRFKNWIILHAPTQIIKQSIFILNNKNASSPPFDSWRCMTFGYQSLVK